MRQITAAIDKAVGDTLSELGDSMIQFVVEETQKAMKDVASKAKDAAKHAEVAKTEEVRSTINFDRSTVEDDKAILVKAGIPMIEESEEETTAAATTTKISEQENDTSTTTAEEIMLDTDTITTEIPATADEDVAAAMTDRATRKIDSSAVKFYEDDAEVDYLNFATRYAPSDFGTADHTKQNSPAAPQTDSSYECEHYNICKLNETLYPDSEIR